MVERLYDLQLLDHFLLNLENVTILDLLDDTHFASLEVLGPVDFTFAALSDAVDDAVVSPLSHGEATLFLLSSFPFHLFFRYDRDCRLVEGADGGHPLVVCQVVCEALDLAQAEVGV